MKDSTEDRIIRRGTGTLVNYPPEIVGAFTWLAYRVDFEEFVWRPQDDPVTGPIDLEVGRRGKQAVFYARVGEVILDRAFATRREAMRFAQEYDAINAIT